MTKPLPKSCHTCKYWYREALLGGPLLDHGDCLGRGPATTTAIDFVCESYRRERGAATNPKTVIALPEPRPSPDRGTRGKAHENV